jgi:AcrR family transcriptional regulator
MGPTVRLELDSCAMDDQLPDLPALPLADVGHEPCERADAAANRERILLAARELFADHGADGVSMDAVALAAGVGKGTVFRRFGARDGLIEALLDTEMRAFQEAFLFGAPPLGPGGDPVARLHAFLTELLALLDRNLELLLGARLDSTHPPRLFASLALHLRVLITEVAPAADADVLADLLMSAMSAPMLRRLRREQGRSLAEVQAGVCALVHGIVPRP